MALTRCPDCDRLVRFKPGRVIKDGFSARYAVLEPHLALGQDTGGPSCPGSGKEI